MAGGAGGGSVGSVGAVGAGAGLSGLAAGSAVQMKGVTSSANNVTGLLSIDSTQVTISTGARAILAAESTHLGTGLQHLGVMAKLEDDLATDALLAALLQPHKKHHEAPIVGALMAAQAVSMYQSIQALGSPAISGASASAAGTGMK